VDTPTAGISDHVWSYEEIADLANWRYGTAALKGKDYQMAGPIISGGKPRTEALFVVALVSLLLVLMSPQLTSMVVRALPRLAPLFGWLHHALDSK
jgi:hypothetical protein